MMSVATSVTCFPFVFLHVTYTEVRGCPFQLFPLEDLIEECYRRAPLLWPPRVT